MERNILYNEVAATAFESPVMDAKAPKTIALYNTDLNAPYFGGNFNFLYNGGDDKATVTFNTYLSYRKNYTAYEKKNFVDNLRDAVAVWNEAAELQIKDRNGNFSKKIKLQFKLNETIRNPKNANKKTDIHPTNTWSSWFNGKNREIVMRELNVFIGSSTNVLVHELGHVWGLMDEYDTKWYEMKFSPAHVGAGSPLIKDTKAIMNIGYQDEISDTGEFRGRYFKHFGRALLQSFWGVKDFMIPVKHNNRIVSETVQGRIALLKKDIAGAAPFTTDVLPFNPQYTGIQVTKVK
jgi:hypothetical protein